MIFRAGKSSFTKEDPECWLILDLCFRVFTFMSRRHARCYRAVLNPCAVQELHDDGVTVGLGLILSMLLRT